MIIALMSGACGIMIMIMLTDVIDEFCRGRSYLRGDIHLRPSTIFYQQLTHDWLGMWLILGWRMEVILLPLRRISQCDVSLHRECCGHIITSAGGRIGSTIIKQQSMITPWGDNIHTGGGVNGIWLRLRYCREGEGRGQSRNDNNNNMDDEDNTDEADKFHGNSIERER